MKWRGGAVRRVAVWRVGEPEEQEVLAAHHADPRVPHARQPGCEADRGLDHTLA